MNKVFHLLLALCISLQARAQVVIISENMFNERMGEFRAVVVDSLTNEPVSFASVYVVPSKDTTITNFTLSDAKGEAKLDEVPFGSYVFHVEMMGYKPFVKERYLRERKVDMGTIRLQPDEQFLQAAVVSDIGNPIVIKKDTVEFNASSFRVGANAMLKDLLQRMPGMEITEDGKVKFNGEEIDKLTVGGRTFFFNDQSAALNNLPAAVVDKIRVIDRDSESTRSTGLQDGSKEKVLDVALKKEYEKGWFGNAGLKGGATLVPEDEDEVLRKSSGVLYSANALVSAYSEKDQLTVIANGQNIDDSNTIFVIYGDNGERSYLNQGLSAAGQAGFNVNTTRIKDTETTVSGSYKYSDTESGTRTQRTTYQDDSDLMSSKDNTGRQFANSVNAGAEFKKEKGKVWFDLNSSYRYSKTISHANGNSETFRAGEFVNRSENATHDRNTRNEISADASVTFRELWGKKNRTIRLGAGAGYSKDGGVSDETSVLTLAGGEDTRRMRYDSDGNASHLDGEIRYTEPFGDKWMLSATGSFSKSTNERIRDAYDGAGRNEYYSSESRTGYYSQQYGLTAQYKFGAASWVTFGGSLMGVLNETWSKSYGIEDMTGKDEWNWSLTPTVRFRHSKGNDRLSFSVSGNSSRPAASRMLPVLNISDPSRLSLGNVYLKPYTQTWFNADWSRSNVKKFSSLMVYLYGQFNFRPVTYASWFDSDGILYSIPVNAEKPGVSASLVANYTTPLDAKKIWSLTLGGGGSYNSSVSYQTRTTLAGPDKDKFDYSDFMSAFWGNEDGDRFYGGESGFAESRTRFFAPSASISLKYNQDHYWFRAGIACSGRIARYSLNPDIDMNTMNTRFSASGSYTTKHEFEFESDITYALFKGYAEGYGSPEWQWNGEISKNIGAFNLSVKVHDILNQTRNLSRTVSANYEEDSYRLVLGRYILFGVKWNFGKMNAAHNQKAQRAVWNMAW